MIAIACAAIEAMGQAVQQEGAAKDPLAARQQIVRDRMAQLEDRMYRLTEKLSRTDPQQARRLEKALRESGELLIRHHMDQAIQLLEQSDLSEAADHQASAAKALEQILTLLTEAGEDSRERQQEIDRLREARKQVDQLLEKQLDLRGRTDPAERLAEQIAEAAARLKTLIQRQEEQSEATRKAILQEPRNDQEKAQALARSQEAIRKDTESLLDQFEQAGATQPDGEPRETPLQHATEGARKELRNAADHMQSAKQDLQQNLPATAEPKQGKALDALKRSLEELKRREAELKSAKPEDAARDQQALEQETGKLADSMQGKQQDKQSGGDKPTGSRPAGSRPSNDARKSQQEGPQEDSSESPEQSDPGMPGGDNIRQAQKHMKNAGGKLQKKQPAAATPEQDKAIAQLQKAQAELQDTLDQVRREQQEEMLAGLEQRFRTMLLEQTKINADTDSLDKRKQQWVRADELNLAGLAEKQTSLSGEAAKALNILREEGTSVVFPDLVGQVRDDMADAAKRLGARQTGSVTHEIQAQIVRALEELIAAVEQRQKDGPPPPPAPNSQAGGEQGSTPLLPSSAELKLLRSCQIRVNRSTQQIDGLDKASQADLVDQAQRISKRQEQLADMARKISERAAGQ